MSFSYQLITLSAIDYHLFLQSDHPEEKILAILADFGEDNPELAIETIAKQVINTSPGDFASKRHLTQLRILAKLRNFESQALDMLYDLQDLLSDERDILYRIGEVKGMKKGEEKANEKFVKKLLRTTDFSMARIASLVEVSEYFVRKVSRTIK
jgi:hypothetical protein